MSETGYRLEDRTEDRRRMLAALAKGPLAIKELNQRLATRMTAKRLRTVREYLQTQGYVRSQLLDGVWVVSISETGRVMLDGLVEKKR